jgi:Protein ENHANCED DISEASE RESISTANCE 2, C-terminal
VSQRSRRHNNSHQLRLKKQQGASDMPQKRISYNGDSAATTAGSNSSISSSCSVKNSNNKESPQIAFTNNVHEFLSYVTSCGNRDTNSTFLNCATSGSIRTNSSNSMQRASVSRRSDNLQSPGLRSRSSEHTMARTEDEQGRGDMLEMKKGSGHCRSMSDPFDSAQSDVISPAATTDDEEDDYYVLSTNSLSIRDVGTEGSNVSVIPTLARYPCVETRNKNCWSEPPISIFSVRGANYCSDQKKVPSDQYILRARGSDLFLTDTKKPFSLDEMYVVTFSKKFFYHFFDLV